MMPSSDFVSSERYNSIFVTEYIDEISLNLSEIYKDYKDKNSSIPIQQPQHNNEKELLSYMTDYSN